MLGEWKYELSAHLWSKVVMSKLGILFLRMKVNLRLRVEGELFEAEIACRESGSGQAACHFTKCNGTKQHFPSLTEKALLLV